MESAVALNTASRKEASVSGGRRWTGFVVTGLITRFMLFDAVMKFVKPQPVADAFVRTGWPIDPSVMLGTTLLISTTSGCANRASPLSFRC